VRASARAPALLLLAWSPAALALNPERPLRDFWLSSWQEELPQNTVHDVVQTRDGYIWFGTYEGLVRFDGVRFKVFDNRNTKELGNSKDLGNAAVFALQEDRAGSLWMGTPGGGAVRYRDGVFRRFGKEDGLPDTYIFAFCEDLSGSLWAGTNGGVARLKGDRFEAVSGVDVRRVRAHGLAVGHDGSVWISAEEGLVRYRSGSVSVFTTKDGLTSDTPRALCVDAKGTLWVGTDGGGLNRYQDGRFTAYTTRDGLAGDVIRALLADREGSLWVGTEGGGLSRIRDGRISSLTQRDGVTSGLIRSFCEDAEGSLWIGTNGGGVICLKDQKVTTYGARHGLTNENVRTVFQDRSGTVWAGSDGGGLYRMEDGRFTSVTSKEGSPGAYVRSLSQGPDGSLWVATNSSGLSRLSDGRWTTLTTKEGLTDKVLTSVFADADGTVWIGTAYTGTNRLRNGVITRDASPDAPATRPISSFLKDSRGALWVASNGGGIAVYRDGTFQRYRQEDGLASNQVYCFHEDASGAVWIGTGGGLCRWKDGRFSSLGSGQGLFDDIAFQILEDARGRFWISCNHGIFSVRRDELEAVLDGRARSVTCTVYGVSDGMAAPQCNGGSTPSAWKTSDGRLWFGTVRGVSVVDPARIPTNRKPPPVQVEEVIADGKPLPRGGAATLAPGVEKLELHYTALSFLAPEKVRFRYKLEGYESAWTEAGTRRTAYYTRLPPGRFRFRVTACNNDGVWNEAGASFSLELLPPWWRTWWAYVLAGAVLVGLVLGLVRLRVRSLERRTVELEKSIQERTVELAASEKRALEANRAKSVFLANMSHELRTPLNGILGFAQLMERKRERDPEDRESLAIISGSGEHLLGLINDVLSLSKIEAGHVSLSVEAFDLGVLLRGLVDVLRARAAAKDVTLTLETNGLPKTVSGDEGKLRQVLLNLLGNAVKFSAEGHVTVRARWDDGRAVVEVEDTGPGLSPEEIPRLFQPFSQTEVGWRSQEGTGLGLALSRQLARLMGGDITVTSVKGEGSTFRLEVELPEAHASSLRVSERTRVVGLAPGQAAPRVLVVDDVPQNRLLLSRLFGAVGFEVREATSGEEAVDEWRRFAPHLVFMDKRMPGMGGLEATRRIREAEGETSRARAVIIAVSASAMEHERGEILASGCDDFVAKPFREATLFGKVAEFLGVEYVYESDQHDVSKPQPLRDLDPGRVALLPRPLRETLIAAFESGDFDAAEEAAEHVRALDADLADALRSAARDVRADEALAALASAARLDEVA
jgi:signal transduction histidine kinase/ligand-binding sensor domain-containing protein/CheY-like chemotaxis protein